MSSPSWKRTVGAFLGGQAVSLFGSAVVGYCVIWYVALDTGNAVDYALLSLAAILPQGIVSLWGGVWADRYNRKALVIGSDAAIAVVTVGLAVVFLTGRDNFVILGGALLIRGVGAGIQTPAVAAILPGITPEEHLLRVNAVNSSIQSAVFLAAPALAAVLLTAMPLGWIFLIDVGTAAIGIGILARIPIPLPAGARAGAGAGAGAGGAGRRRIGQELGDALRFVRRDPVMRRVLALAVVVYVLVMPAGQFAPIVVVKLFGGETWKLAAVEIGYSAAMVAGGAILAAWGGIRNRMTMMLVGAGLWAAFTVAQGLSPNAWVYIALWIPFGLVSPLLTTTAMTVMQQGSPAEMVGRVMGLASLVFALCGPVGLVAMAPIADAVSIRWILIVPGALALLGTLILARHAPAALAPEPADDAH
jgi:DHA3 family macrolide efflux protein-like MFS transporter